MLMRLGEIVISQHNPLVIDGIEKRPCTPGERWMRERAATEFDEGQIMAEVIYNWDFPNEVSDALRTCAQPLEAAIFSPMGAVVHLASLLADQSSHSTDPLALWPVALVQKLNLDLEQLQTNIPDPESFGDTSMV
jgi:HD-like signal output (HDOD) protein